MNCKNHHHGTAEIIAKELQQGKIKTNAGGGELGQGFYMGDQLWVAKSWAKNRHPNNPSTLKITISEDDLLKLSIDILNRTDALRLRREIKRRSQTRTYQHGYDVIWSPIVGSTRIDADQYKYESINSSNLLNSSSCSRELV